MALEIYKRGQGKWTRSVTFGAGAVIALGLAWYVFDKMSGEVTSGTSWGAKVWLYVLYAVPVAIALGGAALMFWIVNRPSSADFMIATEGEMKKVSWSSRREVIGGTKVVIVTTLVLAVLLWAVDLAFGLFFAKIGVLKVGT